MTVSLGFFIAAMIADFATAVVGFIAWNRSDSRRLGQATEWLGRSASVLITVTWAMRWIEAGHLPLFGTWESGLSLAVAIHLGPIFWPLRKADWNRLWPSTAALSLLLLTHALQYDKTIYALTISERSWVVDLHSILAWAAFSALTLNAALAMFRLLRSEEAGRAVDARLGSSLSLGFLLHTAMLCSGSLYKFLLFGRAWSFDPIETLALIAWLSYGTLLHLHLLAGWTGRRLAGWCLVLFVLLTVSYRGIVYFPSWSTYHIFDIDLRLHVVDGGD